MRTPLLMIFVAALTCSFDGCLRTERVNAVNSDAIPLKQKVVTGYVTGKGGVSLYIRIEGNGSPTLVIPGGPGYSFDYLLPYLTELDSSNQMIYLDPRGCGRSAEFRNPAMYTIENMVADIESVRTTLKISALNIIGHETGGMVAQEYAIKHPANVNKLVLMSTTAQVSDLNAWLNNFRDFLPRKVAATIKAYEKDSLIANGQYTPGYENVVLQGMMSSSSYFANAASIPDNFTMPDRSWPVYFEMWGTHGYFDISGNLKDFDSREDLRTLKIKSLVLVGDKDYISNFTMESLVGSLPRSKEQIFDNAGHFFFIEKKDEFIAAVKDFLAK
ncbi:MAG TPA: alpha/beta fold hydrolase [Bacteroidota bacterium]|nr:alpha/beta fold hydrolase [Bacteroidota bacterium]